MRWQRFRHRDVLGSDIEHVLSREVASGLPVSVEAFARYLGVRVEFIYGTSSLTVTNKHATLWIAETAEVDRRYAIAHGLGHLLAGSQQVVHETDDHKHSRDHLRADEFAATLLMPTGSVAAAVAALGENTRALARYYLVPERLVHARLAIHAGSL